jgi:cellulose synthase/poly-beta-1,6-N-acetylglucosamine synthase-like glycosyltransferase
METLILLLPMYFLMYIFFIVRLIIGYGKVRSFAFQNTVPKTTFSIVVPFRNEADNLPTLLESIKNIDYPKTMFEVIFIDDFSKDDSEKTIYGWRMENGEYHITLIESVRISKSPKKDAIARAVPIVANQWIVTTDADCILPKNWLKVMNDFIMSNDVEMLAGPVIYNGKMRLSHHFQQMDLLSLQGSTIGAFGLGKAFMCNGANFAYSKKLFNDLRGFAGNNNTASGDDVFLLQKAMAACPEKVHYLKSKEAIVTTKPVNGWINLFFQRVRWGSKAVQYEHEFGEMLTWAVFLGNASLVTFFCLAVAAKFPWEAIAILFGVKFLFDTVLLAQANRFLRKGRFFFPLLCSAIYPFFCTLVAVYSLVGIYKWKGRTLR